MRKRKEKDDRHTTAEAPSEERIDRKASKRKRKQARTPEAAKEEEQFDDDEVVLERVATEADQETLAQTLKAKDKKRRGKEHFIRSRMWLSTFISKFFSDRGTIPDNIGNNILITNNVYITKNHLTAIIQVKEMSEYTPISWMSELVKTVKDQVRGVVIDITVKGFSYSPDIQPENINSKIRTWKAMLDDKMIPEYLARRAARLLYSYDVVKSGAIVSKRYVYIMVRAKDGTTLNRGIQATTMYLSSIGAQYTRIKNNMNEHINYLLMISDKKPEYVKDLPAVIFSNQTIAESLPMIQGANDTEGVLMGYDVVSGYPYFINFKSTAAAKNIMIEALSGWGKSFMATYWLYPLFADGFNLTIMDVKGNEFQAITEALGGVILSMRPTSTSYINTYVWSVDEVFDGDTKAYANEAIRSCKERLLCICDLPEKESSQAESLLEEFLLNVYESIGARVDNVNTWFRTEQLNPYVVFTMFEHYISLEIKAKYRDVCTKMLERMRIYMSPNGSRSHIYRDPYSYLDVLESRVLTFDFGLMETSNASNDKVMFHLHVMDMVTINDAYVSYKKRAGQWTAKILEESQIVDSWLTKVYVREITLRRSQNQITMLLGNSVAALAANPESRPIVENINILCLGSLNKSSREYLQNEFGLKPAEYERLQDIQTNPDRQRQFLLINRMEANSTTAILEASVPPDVSSGPLFKIVDTEDD